MPWASRLKTPLLVTATASPEIPGRTHAQPDRFKYTFSFWFNSEIQARQICQIGHDTLTQNPQLAGFNRAAILSEDADWTTDFTPIYSKIKNDKANVIMAGVAHVSVPPVVQWHQQQVPALFDGINASASSSDFWSATNGAKALEGTHIEGVMGQIRFYGLDSPFAHELVADPDPAKGASVVAFQWQNGKQMIIWPSRLATGKIEVPSFVPPPSPDGRLPRSGPWIFSSKS
ncbi:hypothetical protein [Castellaniella sp.]|uniref:hypothetical protein n=1 Tax=Castellaniella sp. TaxID=1955812 RepID=UPI002AFE7DC1|nr:hypothetical protein [Castellaniella sp.]